MKKFLLLLLIFILIPVLFTLLVEVGISITKKSIFEKKHVDKIYENVGAEYQWITKVKSTNKIILAGSSTVRYGLSCSRLNTLSKDSLSFVSIAYDARDPIETFYILKQIDLTNVKSIYFALDPWIFTKNFYRHRDPYLYLDMGFWSAVMYCAEYDNLVFLKRDIQFYKYLFPTKDKRAPVVTNIPSDFGTFTLKQKPLNFDEPVESWFQLEKYGWSQLQFQYLSKIESLCRQKNIKFSMFIVPKRDDFCKSVRYECENNQREFVARLVELGLNSPIFGKYDLLNTNKSTEYFQDIYHLNPKGQEFYSNLFFKMMNNKKEIISSKYNWFRSEN